jgi:hypothetical protein
MNKKNDLLYHLRKSHQDQTSIPILRKNDFPLRFYFKGKEVNVTVTKKGHLEIKYVKSDINSEDLPSSEQDN